MAMQSIWSGTISFSLVAIPVQLVRAVKPDRVSFRLLHTKDYSPLARRMFCPREEKIVSPEDIIRGYEIGPDAYITVTDEELESVSPERSRTIEIVEFVNLPDIDSIYYDHPYYLVPSKGGEKAYQLLAEVMRRTNKAGLAKFVMGEREYFVAIKNIEGALSLITLHYSEEILPDDGILPQASPADALETARMKKIIKEMIVGFHPDRYTNERRKSMLTILKKKAKKQPPVMPPEVAEEDEGPVDLVAALEASMRKVKKKR
ncbi:MAG: Ku protein [Deltaproteobacteria bacterium HGW-Deltaproteobacteria-6]|jgi:DNA end-binding protein Ku|nr:MAG: Ku protein [Deltaproteobacteria bacterium HGW-Deltaproteobacteria-6]